jgi:hypothetical protein
MVELASDGLLGHHALSGGADYRVARDERWRAGWWLLSFGGR